MKRSETGPDDLGAAELAAWGAFVVAATQVIGALDTEIKAGFGIGHFDFALLFGLLQSPRREARMSDLAWRMRLTPSNITHRVGRLERRGLVVRRSDPGDGRVVLARLTPKAVRLLREARPLVRDSVRREFLAHIDPERLASLTEAFAAIADSRGPAQESRSPAQP